MDTTQIAKLLGRPLTSNETANFDLYIDIAEEALEGLICSPITDIEEARTFDIREGYSTAFLDIFRSVSEVMIDGEIIDSSDYSLRQWDKRSASWYNSLVFDDRFKSYQGEVTVTAEWGFAEPEEGQPSNIPIGLQMILAGLFAQVSKVNRTDSSIASKQVEDFRITFNVNNDLDAEFLNKYGSFVAKYSTCGVGYLRHERKHYGH